MPWDNKDDRFDDSQYGDFDGVGFAEFDRCETVCTRIDGFE
jgi:hypothetical protein